MTLPYRLLALDLDGTLLDQRLVFSPAVRSAVAAALAAGVQVTLATGRMVRTTQPFADQLNIALPLICYQGAHMQARDGTVLQHTPVAPDYASEIVQLAHSRDMYIQAYIDDELWIQAARPELDLYLGFSTVPIPVNLVADLAAKVRESAPTKLLWIAEPPLLEQTLSEWAVRWAGQLSIFRSHHLFGEAAAPDSSKGVALAALARHLGIDQAQVAAIGDRQNDAPMLEWAGLGLAMGNADEYARAAADHMLPAFDQDGAAWGIRRWILGEAV
jgi:Cof subfamily protein (haloacid dehalogenase superfamily)